MSTEIMVHGSGLGPLEQHRMLSPQYIDWRQIHDQKRPTVLSVFSPSTHTIEMLEELSSEGNSTLNHSELSSAAPSRQSSVSSVYSDEDCCPVLDSKALDAKQRVQVGSGYKVRQYEPATANGSATPCLMLQTHDVDYDDFADAQEYVVDRQPSSTPQPLASACETSTDPASTMRRAQQQVLATPEISISGVASQTLDDVSICSDNSSAIIAIDFVGTPPRTSPLQDATGKAAATSLEKYSAANRVYDAANYETNGYRAKGKAKLTSIRNISWELVEEQDVRAFCKAYDISLQRLSDATHVTMGLVQSIHSLFTGADQKQAASWYRQSMVTQTMTIPRLSPKQTDTSMRPDAECKAPSSKDLRPDPKLPVRQSERLREQQRRRLEECTAQTADDDLREQQRLSLEDSAAEAEEGERRIQQNLQRLSDQAAALKQAAKQRRLDELRRREEADLAATFALQKRLDEEEAEARRIAERLARIKLCTVCGDEQDEDNFPAKAPTPKCQHPPQICTECMESWIASAFQDQGIDGIKCPECPQKLAYEDVQIAASASTFEAYDKATIANALSSLPEFAWCLAPSCKSGQLNVDNSNYMECASCGYKQCLEHKIPWHRGETCEKYEYRTSGAKAREEEAQTLVMLDTMSKLCPGPNCGWRIEKTDGCDHMTCRKCRHEFCWRCLASHAEIRRIGNTAHKRDCKFHSTNLEVAWPFNRH